MLNQDFTVSKVSWSTQQKGNEQFREMALENYRSLFIFLQDHNLVVRTILQPGELVTDEMELRWSDLNERGKLLMRQYHDKWLKSIDDIRKPQDDVSVLQRGLKKIDEKLAEEAD